MEDFLQLPSWHVVPAAFLGLFVGSLLGGSSDTWRLLRAEVTRALGIHHLVRRQQVLSSQDTSQARITGRWIIQNLIARLFALTVAYSQLSSLADSPARRPGPLPLALALAGCLTHFSIHTIALLWLLLDADTALSAAPRLHPRVSLLAAATTLACHVSGLLPTQFQVAAISTGALLVLQQDPKELFLLQLGTTTLAYQLAHALQPYTYHSWPGGRPAAAAGGGSGAICPVVVGPQHLGSAVAVGGMCMGVNGVTGAVAGGGGGAVPATNAAMQSSSFLGLALALIFIYNVFCKSFPTPHPDPSDRTTSTSASAQPSMQPNGPLTQPPTSTSADGAATCSQLDTTPGPVDPFARPRSNNHQHFVLAHRSSRASSMSGFPNSTLPEPPSSSFLPAAHTCPSTCPSSAGGALHATAAALFPASFLTLPAQARVYLLKIAVVRAMACVSILPYAATVAVALAGPGGGLSYIVYRLVCGAAAVLGVAANGWHLVLIWRRPHAYLASAGRVNRGVWALTALAVLLPHLLRRDPELMGEGVLFLSLHALPHDESGPVYVGGQLLLAAVAGVVMALGTAGPGAGSGWGERLRDITLSLIICVIACLAHLVNQQFRLHTGRPPGAPLLPLRHLRAHRLSTSSANITPSALQSATLPNSDARPRRNSIASSMDTDVPSHLPTELCLAAHQHQYPGRTTHWPLRRQASGSDVILRRGEAATGAVQTTPGMMTWGKSSMAAGTSSAGGPSSVPDATESDAAVAGLDTLADPGLPMSYDGTARRVSVFSGAGPTRLRTTISAGSLPTTNASALMNPGGGGGGLRRRTSVFLVAGAAEAEDSGEPSDDSVVLAPLNTVSGDTPSTTITAGMMPHSAPVVFAALPVPTGSVSGSGCGSDIAPGGPCHRGGSGRQMSLRAAALRSSRLTSPVSPRYGTELSDRGSLGANSIASASFSTELDGETTGPGGMDCPSPRRSVGELGTAASPAAPAGVTPVVLPTRRLSATPPAASSAADAAAAFKAPRSWSASVAGLEAPVSVPIPVHIPVSAAGSGGFGASHDDDMSLWSAEAAIALQHLPSIIAQTTCARAAASVPAAASNVDDVLQSTTTMTPNSPAATMAAASATTSRLAEILQEAVATAAGTAMTANRKTTLLDPNAPPAAEATSSSSTPSVCTDGAVSGRQMPPSPLLGVRRWTSFSNSAPSAFASAAAVGLLRLPSSFMRRFRTATGLTSSASQSPRAGVHDRPSDGRLDRRRRRRHSCTGSDSDSLPTSPPPSAKTCGRPERALSSTAGTLRALGHQLRCLTSAPDSGSSRGGGGNVLYGGVASLPEAPSPTVPPALAGAVASFSVGLEMAASLHRSLLSYLSPSRGPRARSTATGMTDVSAVSSSGLAAAGLSDESSRVEDFTQRDMVFGIIYSVQHAWDAVHLWQAFTPSAVTRTWLAAAMLYGIALAAGLAYLAALRRRDRWTAVPRWRRVLWSVRLTLLHAARSVLYTVAGMPVPSLLGRTLVSSVAFGLLGLPAESFLRAMPVKIIVVYCLSCVKEPARLQPLKMVVSLATYFTASTLAYTAAAAAVSRAPLRRQRHAAIHCALDAAASIAALERKLAARSAAAAARRAEGRESLSSSDFSDDDASLAEEVLHRDGAGEPCCGLHSTDFGVADMDERGEGSAARRTRPNPLICQWHTFTSDGNMLAVTVFCALSVLFTVLTWVLEWVGGGVVRAGYEPDPYYLIDQWVLRGVEGIVLAVGRRLDAAEGSSGLPQTALALSLFAAAVAILVMSQVVSLAFSASVDPRLERYQCALGDLAGALAGMQLGEAARQDIAGAVDRHMGEALESCSALLVLVEPAPDSRQPTTDGMIATSSASPGAPSTTPRTTARNGMCRWGDMDKEPPAAGGGAGGCGGSQPSSGSAAGGGGDGIQRPSLPCLSGCGGGEGGGSGGGSWAPHATVYVLHDQLLGAYLPPYKLPLDELPSVVCAVSAGSPLLLNDTTKASDQLLDRFTDWRSARDVEGARSVAVVPLVFSGVGLGALVLHSPLRHVMDAAFREMLSALAGQLAQVIYLKRALEDVRADEQLLSDLMPTHVAHTLKRRLLTSQEDALTLPMYAKMSSVGVGVGGGGGGVQGDVGPLVNGNGSVGSASMKSPSVGAETTAETAAAAVILPDFASGSLDALMEKHVGSVTGAVAVGGGGGGAAGQSRRGTANGFVVGDDGGSQGGYLRGSSNGSGSFGSVMAAAISGGGGGGPREGLRQANSRRGGTLGMAAALRQHHHHYHHQQQGGGEGCVGGGGEGEVSGRMSVAAGGTAAVLPLETAVGVVYQQWHSDVTILFADIVQFTPMSQAMEPQQVMMMLHELFSRYDALLERHCVYKVETIGDCYMAATGLLTHDPDHAAHMLDFAIGMLGAAATVAVPLPGGGSVRVRVGLHTGRVMSGVVGAVRARYCLFGDTVNTASRMESTGVPMTIQASETTFHALPADRQAGWQFRGSIDVKGKGAMNTYLYAPQELAPTAPPAPAPSTTDVVAATVPAIATTTELITITPTVTELI